MLHRMVEAPSARTTRAEAIAGIPLGRVGTAEEIVLRHLFFASPESLVLHRGEPLRTAAFTRAVRSPRRDRARHATEPTLMRAVAFERPGEVVVRELPEPVPGPGEALVAPRYVGLCGTDLELLDGTMPYFAEGLALYPLQPGHEVAGVVVKAPDGSLPPGTPAPLHPLVGCGTCAACRRGSARTVPITARSACAAACPAARPSC